MGKPTRADFLGRLGDIASLQEGFFSSVQAQEVGVTGRRLARMVTSGILERDKRGIYRFASYPDSDLAELWRAVLWPNVSRSTKINDLGKGVLSYATALDLWNVSTINPSKIDLTLPKSYRLRRAVSPVYRIHRADLAAKEITFIRGLPVTTLYRTLLDLICDGQEQQFVDETLEKSDLLTESDRRQLKALKLAGPAKLNDVFLVLGSRAS